MIRRRGQILKLLLLVSSTYSAGVILYAYCEGDPVNKWDPTGLAAYFFDGTGNHPLAANLDGSANFKTNVRYLFDAYIGDAFYAYGIGTGYDPAGGVYSKDTLAEGVGIERQDSELATGGTMHERVNWMIQRLEGQLAKGDKNVETAETAERGAERRRAWTPSVRRAWTCT